MLDKLPTELWYRVTQFLPTNVHKTCLSVSKMHHDIVQQYVFEHVIITLELWEGDEAHFHKESDHPDATQPCKLAKYHFDFLLHIKNTADFACLIKKFIVRAYAPSGESTLAHQIC